MCDATLSDAALGALAILADLSPSDVSTLTVTQLFTQLPDPSPFPDAGSSLSKPQVYVKTLESLATLCHRTELFETFSVRLLNRIEFACAAGSRAVGCDEDEHNLYAHHLLLTLYIVLQTKVEGADAAGCAQVAIHAERILSHLFGLFLSEDEVLGRPALPDEAEQEAKIGTPDDQDVLVVRERVSIRNDEKLVADAGKIVKLVVRQMDTGSALNCKLRTPESSADVMNRS